MKMPTDAELYLSDARGIFIPRDFATSIKRECVDNVTAGDWEVLAAGPDHECYWVTWSDVERTAVFTNPVTGRVYHLYQDGDLWLVPIDAEWPEESES